MKIVNVILAVMILGLVGTSIFFASTLHSKRYLIKARADKMRDTLVTFAGNVDELLQIKQGAEITKEKLHHTQRASVIRETLSNLMKQQETFAKYQEVCIQKLSESVQILGISEIFNAESAFSETLINKVKPELAQGAAKLVARDAGIIEALTAVAGEYEITVTAETLANLMDIAPATTACVAVGEKIDQTWMRMSSYEDTLTRLARLAGVSAPDFEGDYQSGLTQIHEKMAALDPAIAELDNSIADANGQIKTLNGEIKDRDDQIVALNADIAEREKTKADLTNILTLPAPEPKPWQSSDRTIVLDAIRGTVTAISPEWNFVVINCGAKNQIKQPGTENVVAAPVPGKAYHMVVAQAGTQLPLFAGRVTIARTDNDYCVVNIDHALRNASRPIAVGDQVFFTVEEVGTIVSDENKAPVKSEAEDSSAEAAPEGNASEDTFAAEDDSFSSDEF